MSPIIAKDIAYTVGIEDLFLCFQTDPGDSTTAPTYETDVYRQTNISDVTISTTQSAFSKFASNKKIINMVKNSSFGLAFNLAGLNAEVRDKMFGRLRERGISFENADAKEYPKFAVGLVLPQSDGTFLLRWYPGCSIAPSDESYATQTDEMTVNDTAYTITADPLLLNNNTMAELDTAAADAAGITVEQFMSQVVYDESQIATLFPTTP